MFGTRTEKKRKKMNGALEGRCNGNNYPTKNENYIVRKDSMVVSSAEKFQGNRIFFFLKYQESL